MARRIIIAFGFLLAAGLMPFPAISSVKYEVTIYPEVPVVPVSSMFWGTNFLFWIEDDEALADGRIENAMKSLPVRVLRYPGGTVADNFHWKTNMLDNNSMFPYEEGETESDFDEFMAFCRKVGAEPVLVVNTQSWFLKGDIAGGAEEAADWVRYCREKGYGVKYWEIGNETYWHTVMTAKEYGRLARIYAEAMKEADPSVILGVNGGWDIDMTGNKERTDPALWEEIRQDYLDVYSLDDSKRLKEKTDAAVKKPWTEGEEKWWDGVLSECGDQIGMLSVHWYYHDNVIRHIDRKMVELREYAEEKTGRNLLVCLSEYNCNTEGMELRMPGFAESVGRFLNAGTDIACFWPFRIGGGTTAKTNRNMLSLERKEPQYPYQILRLFQEKLTGCMVRCESHERVYAFASRSERAMTVVLSGRQLRESSFIDLALGMEVGEGDVEVTMYTPDKENISIKSETVPFKLEGGRLQFGISPETFVMVNVKS